MIPLTRAIYFPKKDTYDPNEHSRDGRACRPWLLEPKPQSLPFLVLTHFQQMSIILSRWVILTKILHRFSESIAFVGGFPGSPQKKKPSSEVWFSNSPFELGRFGSWSPAGGTPASCPSWPAVRLGPVAGFLFAYLFLGKRSPLSSTNREKPTKTC